MTTDTDTIRQQWTHLSSGWEEQRDFLLDMSRPVHDWLIDHLEPAEGERVLEIGAGPGDTGFLAAPKLGANGRLVSTDLSPRMLEVARRRAEELGVANVEFQTVDAQAMPFSDGTFDGVISRWIYMLMPDPALGLRETRRVLKSGGRLVFAVFTGPADNAWASLPVRLLVEGGHLPPPAPGAPGILALGDHDQLAALVRNAGFDSFRIDAVSFDWRHPDVQTYWDFLEQVTALGPLLQGLSPSVQAALREGLSESLKDFVDDSGIRMSARCWMVVATAP